MRIKGTGSGSSGFGGSSSRSDSFKHGRKPGDKVNGRLLKWVADDMAWVNIDGHKLLAQLHSKPPEGAYLTFLIKQLVPDIILKEIFAPSQTGANALSLAGNFETARTLFENRFRRHQATMTTPHLSRFPHFIELLTADTDLAITFMDATRCLQQINDAIDTTANGALAYHPWLTPTARRQITLLHPVPSGGGADGDHQVTLEFDLNKLGMVRAVFHHSAEGTHYRLKLQRPAKGNELKQYLTSRANQWGLKNVQCMDVAKLPPSDHGGLLAALVFGQ